MQNNAGMNHRLAYKHACRLQSVITYFSSSLLISEKLGVIDAVVIFLNHSCCVYKMNSTDSRRAIMYIEEIKFFIAETQ